MSEAHHTPLPLWITLNTIPGRVATMALDTREGPRELPERYGHMRDDGWAIIHDEKELDAWIAMEGHAMDLEREGV